MAHVCHRFEASSQLCAGALRALPLTMKRLGTLLILGAVACSAANASSSTPNGGDAGDGGQYPGPSCASVDSGSSASTQTVTFRLNNGGTTDRWVYIGTVMYDPVMGEPRGGFESPTPNGDSYDCDPIAIMSNGSQLSLHRSFECGCECAAHAPQNDFKRVAHGESLAILWNATQIETTACVKEFSTGTCVGNGHVFAPRAAPPGSYHAAFFVTDCGSDAGDAACAHQGFGQCPSFGSSPGTDFTLPASGDITVDIAL
jgi:hypothetical protein